MTSSLPRLWLLGIAIGIGIAVVFHRTRTGLCLSLFVVVAGQTFLYLRFLRFLILILKVMILVSAWLAHNF